MRELGKIHDVLRRMNGRIQAVTNNLKLFRHQTADNFQRVTDNFDRMDIKREADYDALMTKIKINEADISRHDREIMAIAGIALIGWLIVFIMVLFK